MSAALALALIGTITVLGGDNNSPEHIRSEFTASNMMSIFVSAFTAVEHADSHFISLAHRVGELTAYTKSA